MSDLVDLIDALGGVSALARDMGVPVQTVHSWKAAERVPQWRLDALRTAAERKGVSLPREFAAPRAAVTQ